MGVKLVLLFSLVTLTLARPEELPYGFKPTYEPKIPAQFNFEWLVKDDYSGNDFGQQESRNGYDTTGSYYVLLPDGRLQRVSYKVSGDSGFVAEVTYEGEARYDEPQVYNAPQPKPKSQYS